MVPVREPVVSPAATLRDAVEVIEATRLFIAAVIDDDRRLVGVVSDGDIRRALLAGKDLQSPVTAAMTLDPITFLADAPHAELIAFMAAMQVAAVPLIDGEGRFQRVVAAHKTRAEVGAPAAGSGFACAIIMAGGEGRRLYPLTADRPKPMLEIGGMPLLERQVRAMERAGVRRIFIATNYLAHVIESHFGDGAAFGIEIHYLREPERLGTAGALSLLPAQDAPILVVNGDVLTTSNYQSLLAFHLETGAFITVAAAMYRMDVPYGVLEVDGHRAVNIVEKPTQTFLCNAGLYVLDAAAVAMVPPGRRLDMTDHIEAAIAAGKPVSVFPVHEYWTDIGSPGDLERARREFDRNAR